MPPLNLDCRVTNRQIIAEEYMRNPITPQIFPSLTFHIPEVGAEAGPMQNGMILTLPTTNVRKCIRTPNPPPTNPIHHQHPLLLEEDEVVDMHTAAITDFLTNLDLPQVNPETWSLLDYSKILHPLTPSSDN